MNTPLTLSDMLSMMDNRIEAIQKKVDTTCFGNHVLMWDNGLCVVIHEGKASAAGYEHATIFGDEEAALVWLRRGIRNGSGERPRPVRAFNAAQHAEALCLQAKEHFKAIPIN